MARHLARTSGDRVRRDALAFEAAVLAELVRAGAPLSAYELIARLALSAPPAPSPTRVYRALDHMEARSAARRVVSLAAWTHEVPASPVDLVCTSCGRLTTVRDDALHLRLRQAATGCGYPAAQQIIEVHGTCAACTSGKV